MDHKTFTSFVTKASDQGIVEAIVAVMGNVDDGGDIIHSGAFTRTIVDRLGKIKVLDAHRTDSINRIIGKPLEMRELSKQELPPDLLMRYPDATGGLWTKTQFLIDTPEGAGAFARIKSQAADEWSIGYDALDTDNSFIKKDGKDIAVRNLRTIKLYEYSPCIWAMNSATATLSAKEKPSEAKPWRAIEEDGVWRVYKLDADGNPEGEALGEHETEEEAQAQVRALYANAGGEADGKSAKAGRRMRRDKTEILGKIESLLSELRSWANYDEEEPTEEDPATDEDADSKPDDKQGGPGTTPPISEAKAGTGPGVTPPTSDDILRQIDIETEALRLLEV